MTRQSASLIIFVLATSLAGAQETSSPAELPGGEEVYEYRVGEVNWLTGQGVSAGGVLVPELFFTGSWGAFEPGSGPRDFATSEHDPQVNGALQAIEVHLLLNVNDVLTGAATAFAHEIDGWELEAELEEAYLHYQVTEAVAIGGGQFLNALGFQNTRHLHDWDFVNQNLTNSRILNEGHLITQGGELRVRLPSHGLLTIGGGGVLTHAHEHGEEHEEEHHHLDAHEAGFNDWVVSADARVRLPIDPSITVSSSFAAGENGFGRNTQAYGFGLRKVWNGHDHGAGGPDFCTGAFLFQTEFLGRSVDAIHVAGEADEADEELSFQDYGFSTGFFYGLSDQVTLALRHDWVSAVEEAELADTHRISPAMTVLLGADQRWQARLQYDWLQSDAVESEHAAWFQLQYTWGGEGGGHRGHEH